MTVSSGTGCTSDVDDRRKHVLALESDVQNQNKAEKCLKPPSREAEYKTTPGHIYVPSPTPFPDILRKSDTLHLLNIW